MLSHIEDFLNYLNFERGYSKHTLSSYRKDLSQFSEQYKARAVGDLGRLDLTDYVAYLYKKGMRPSTISRKLAALKSFFKYLMAEGLIKKNPADKMQLPKTSKLLPKTLTRKDVEILIEAPKGKDAVSLRDRAMLELLYVTKAKVVEVLKDYLPNFAHIETGKGLDQKM